MGLALQLHTAAARTPEAPTPDHNFGTIATGGVSLQDVITGTATVARPDTTQNIVWFEFTLDSESIMGGAEAVGRFLQANTTGSGITNTAMGLYSPSGTLLAQNGDTPSSIAPGYLEPGVYLLGVCEDTSGLLFVDNWATNINPPSGTSTAKLNVTFAPVPQYTFGTIGSGSHAYEGIYSALPDDAHNIVWFQFTIATSLTLVADTVDSNIADTIMALYAPDGTVTEQNDDSIGDPPWSEVSPGSIAAGTYLVGVLEWGVSLSFDDGWVPDGSTVAGSDQAKLNLSLT